MFSILRARGKVNIFSSNGFQLLCKAVIKRLLCCGINLLAPISKSEVHTKLTSDDI